MVLDSIARNMVEVVHVKNRVPWSLVQKGLLPGDEDLVLQVWDAVIARTAHPIRSMVATVVVAVGEEEQILTLLTLLTCGSTFLWWGRMWGQESDPWVCVVTQRDFTLGHDCNQLTYLYHRGVNSTSMKMYCNNHSQK